MIAFSRIRNVYLFLNTRRGPYEKNSLGINGVDGGSASRV